MELFTLNQISDLSFLFLYVLHITLKKSLDGNQPDVNQGKPHMSRILNYYTCTIVLVHTYCTYVFLPRPIQISAPTFLFAPSQLPRSHFTTFHDLYVVYVLFELETTYYSALFFTYSAGQSVVYCRFLVLALNFRLQFLFKSVSCVIISKLFILLHIFLTHSF